jgi:hypothetical protein
VSASPAARERALASWPVLLFVLCLLMGSLRVHAATEHEVKAAFLFNFLKFVEWPGSVASSNTPIVIGVVGESPLREALPKILDGQTVKGRSIRMVSLRPGDPIDECQLLFVAHGTNEETEEVLKAAKGKPILTVGESPEFLPQGGMINFVVMDQKVRFEINTAALDAAGLRADSRLLAVARRVKT